MSFLKIASRNPWKVMGCGAHCCWFDGLMTQPMDVCAIRWVPRSYRRWVSRCRIVSRPRHCFWVEWWNARMLFFRHMNGKDEIFFFFLVFEKDERLCSVSAWEISLSSQPYTWQWHSCRPMLFLKKKNVWSFLYVIGKMVRKTN